MQFPPIPFADPAWRDTAWYALQSHVYGIVPAVASDLALNLIGEGEADERTGRSYDYEVELPHGRRVRVRHAVPHGPARSLIVGAAFQTVSERDPNRKEFDEAQIVRAGFELATYGYEEVVPDDAALAKPILESVGPDVKAIGLWGWSVASIGLSFHSRLPLVFVGHSRLGKAALVAGAIPGVSAGVAAIQSGTGGAAPSRKGQGETVEQITAMFRHWFSPRYQVDDLPIDQHWLLALIAPQRVLLLNAEEDEWADPAGQASMASLASPAWSEGQGPRTFLRPGDHRVTAEDWTEILAHFG